MIVHRQILLRVTSACSYFVSVNLRAAVEAFFSRAAGAAAGVVAVKSLVPAGNVMVDIAAWP